MSQAEFSERILIKSADGKEATIKLIDGKATREFLAQLPMNVSFMDFGKREKFWKSTK